MEGHRKLEENQNVSFDTTDSQKGKKAINVKILGG
jgi:cold shock CspA family protein